jgi:hypothetical protein
VRLKGAVARDGFLAYSNLSRIDREDLNFFIINRYILILFSPFKVFSVNAESIFFLKITEI